MASLKNEELYFLRTAPHPTTANPRYSGMYLRHHAGGINAVMLSPNPPKFLRFHLSSKPNSESQGNAQLATSWGHPGRLWSFVLLPDHYQHGERLGRWEQVRIVETLPETGGSDAWDDGFIWIKDVKADGTEQEVLIHQKMPTNNESEDVKEPQKDTWQGWIVSEWAYGHPQLFWTTGEWKDEEMKLPEHCERVVVLREPIFGQPNNQISAGA